MKTLARSLVLAAAAVAAISGLTGCTTVQPWERANLADFTMNPERDPLHAAMTDHVYFSREGSTGGRGVGGGGCGCN